MPLPAPRGGIGKRSIQCLEVSIHKEKLMFLQLAGYPTVLPHLPIKTQMSQVATFLPLILSGFVFAGILKLSARIFKSARVSWQHCFTFVGILIILTMVRLYFFHDALNFGHPAIGVVAGMLAVVAFGGWYFKGRAKTRDEGPFTFARGSAFTAITIGIMFAFSMAVVLLLGLSSAADGAEKGQTDFTAEAVEFSHENGSTLLANENGH